MANNRENPFGSYFSFFGAKVIKLLGWAKALGPPTMGNCLIWCSAKADKFIRAKGVVTLSSDNIRLSNIS